MPDLTSWLMVFLRVSALLAIFPVFSLRNIPLQVRLALGVLLAFLIGPVVPPVAGGAQDFLGLVGLMAMEVGIGLLLGFASRMAFYALDLLGGIVSAEMGLIVPPSLSPFGDAQVPAPGVLLTFLAAVLWLTLDLHHWLLLALQQSYSFLPIGGARLSEELALDLLGRTGGMFLLAVQMAAPLIAVSFIVTLVFSVLGRAVPQMNVFFESFAVRIMSGLAVFGLSCQLMAQHIGNYLDRLPDDVLRVAQLLGMN